MARLTLQYQRNGEYGETVCTSTSMTEQAMVDEMYAKVLPGIALKFIGENGVILPTGYTGDARLYIPAKA